VKSSQKSNVTVKDDINPDIAKYYGNKLMISANAELIKIALNNIVENANKHAFTDDNQNYILDFKIGLGYNDFNLEDTNQSVDEIKTFIKIEISNNGNPFPKNFGFKKFIRKNSFAGTNGNTGIGGYDINEIVKYHKGELLLINNKSSELFVTSFSIFLPLDN
jgi:type I restriction enzyme M protein